MKPEDQPTLRTELQHHVEALIAEVYACLEIEEDTDPRPHGCTIQTETSFKDEPLNNYERDLMRTAVQAVHLARCYKNPAAQEQRLDDPRRVYEALGEFFRVLNSYHQAYAFGRSYNPINVEISE